MLGMKERGGRIVAGVVPDVKKETLREIVNETVEPGSIVSTDELMNYNLLEPDGYTHGTVKHGQKEYAYYDYRHDAVHRFTPFATTASNAWRLVGPMLRASS